MAADLKSPEEKLWHSKYFIRKNMLPKFISEDVARKVPSVLRVSMQRIRREEGCCESVNTCYSAGVSFFEKCS